MSLIAQVFLKLLTLRDALKCAKGLISENPSIVNVLINAKQMLPILVFFFFFFLLTSTNLLTNITYNNDNQDELIINWLFFKQ